MLNAVKMIEPVDGDIEFDAEELAGLTKKPQGLGEASPDPGNR